MLHRFSSSDALVCGAWLDSGTNSYYWAPASHGSMSGKTARHVRVRVRDPWSSCMCGMRLMRVAIFATMTHAGVWLALLTRWGMERAARHIGIAGVET